MRLAIFLTFATAVLAQQTSPTGFGRMLFPGTGGPTGPAAGGLVIPTGPGGGFGRILYPGTGGAPAAIRPGFGTGGIIGGVIGRGVGSGLIGGTIVGAPPVITGGFPLHPAHTRSTLIPFPVFYGGGYYNAFEPPAAATPYTVDPYDSQRAPVIIINQNYQPETLNPVLRDYSNTPLPPAAPRPAPQTAPQAPPQAAARDPHADDPTIYLIVLTDSTIFEAVAYWVQGDTLNYITVEGSHNRATLDLVDYERSKRLNDERKVEFKLPRR